MSTERTNAEIEALLIDLAVNFSSAAMTIRQNQSDILSVFASSTREGDVGMGVIPDMRYRMEALKLAMKQYSGVGFALVYDGYVTQGDYTKKCVACGGKVPSCVYCRGTGFTLVSRNEAIHANVRTNWGYKWARAYPYKWENGQMTTLPAVELDSGIGIDGYHVIWPETDQKVN